MRMLSPSGSPGMSGTIDLDSVRPQILSTWTAADGWPLMEPEMGPAVLRRLRDRLGYTQVRFAALLGVHPLTVSRWECGTLTPSLAGLRLLRAIDTALNLDPAQLPSRLSGVSADPIRELTIILVVLHPDLACTNPSCGVRALRSSLCASG